MEKQKGEVIILAALLLFVLSGSVVVIADKRFHSDDYGIVKLSECQADFSGK